MKDFFAADFGRIQPFTVGFGDTLELMREAAAAASKAVSYPPYNIKQVTANKYVIEMAVAGFAKSDIEMTLEGNKLVIKAASKDAEEEEYLYKGIGDRLPIIASGGIFKPADAKAKLDAGASLVQVWTGFIYEGPAIVKNILEALKK